MSTELLANNGKIRQSPCNGNFKFNSYWAMRMCLMEGFVKVVRTRVVKVWRWICEQCDIVGWARGGGDKEWDETRIHKTQIHLESDYRGDLLWSWGT
eukprot:3822808-Amphidinium_carterae.1